jgi:hypothetical protein
MQAGGNGNAVLCESAGQPSRSIRFSGQHEDRSSARHRTVNRPMQKFDAVCEGGLHNNGIRPIPLERRTQAGLKSMER